MKKYLIFSLLTILLISISEPVQAKKTPEEKAQRREMRRQRAREFFANLGSTILQTGASVATEFALGYYEQSCDEEGRKNLDEIRGYIGENSNLNLSMGRDIIDAANSQDKYRQADYFGNMSVDVLENATGKDLSMMHTAISGGVGISRTVVDTKKAVEHANDNTGKVVYTTLGTVLVGAQVWDCYEQYDGKKTQKRFYEWASECDQLWKVYTSLPEKSKTQDMYDCWFGRDNITIFQNKVKAIEYFGENDGENDQYSWDYELWSPHEVAAQSLKDRFAAMVSRASLQAASDNPDYQELLNTGVIEKHMSLYPELYEMWQDSTNAGTTFRKDTLANENLLAELQRAIRIGKPVNIDKYECGKTQVTKKQKDWLDAIAPVIIEENMRIIIIGHACDIGTEEANFLIGQDRADAICNYLIKKGVPKSNITTISKGQTEPLLVNTSEANRKANRRVEIIAH